MRIFFLSIIFVLPLMAVTVAAEKDVITLQQGMDGFKNGSIEPDGVHGCMTRLAPEKGTNEIKICFNDINSAVKFRTDRPRVISARLEMYYMYEWCTAYRHEVRCEDVENPKVGTSIDIYGEKLREKATKGKQWLGWELPPEIVQRWIDDPKRNSGLRLYFKNSELLDKASGGGKELGFIGNSEKITRYRPRLIITYDAQVIERDNGLNPITPKWVTDFSGRTIGKDSILRWTTPTSENISFEIEVNTGKGWEAKASNISGDVREITWSENTPGNRQLRIRAKNKDKASAWVESNSFSCVSAPVYMRLSALPTVLKIRRDIPLEWKPENKAEIALALNEEEGVQLVIDHVDKRLSRVCVTTSDLVGDNGGIIKAGKIRVRPVGYVKTVSSPQYLSEYEGWHADVLLEIYKFDIEPETVQPIWISLRAGNDITPGVYRGNIKVNADGMPEQSFPFVVTIWKFALPAQQSIPVFVAGGTNFSAYGYDKNSKEAKSLEIKHEDLLFNHRMMPYSIAAKFTWNSALLPAKGESFDFKEWDKDVERILEKGAPRFIIASAPRLGKFGFPREYNDRWKKDMRHYLEAMCAHLKEKGWLDKAMFYSIDEAANHEVESCKILYKMVKDIEPSLKVIQTLNNPGSIQTLFQYFDIIDVNLRQYNDAKIAELQEKGKEAWLYLCCWPSESPNLFTDYSGIDPRVFGWMCWKFKAKGQVYWQSMAWKGLDALGEKKYIDTICSTWDPVSFGNYNGDGTLLYPGPQGAILCSTRIENYRDGLEDFEYLVLLKKMIDQGKLTGDLLKQANAILAVDDKICDAQFGYDIEGKYMLQARRQIAQILEKAVR